MFENPMRNEHEEEYPVVDCDDDSNNISDDESNVTTADDNDNECDLQEFGEKQDGRSAHSFCRGVKVR